MLFRPFFKKIISFPIILFACVSYYSSEGQMITTFAGNGYEGISGNGGPAVCAGTAYPTDVHLDGKGYLFLSTLSTIRKVNIATGIITHVAGGGKGEDNLAVNANIKSVYEICTDKIGNIYFTDHLSHSIRRIDTNGIIATIVGNGTPGFAGDGGLASNAMINYPMGIITDPDGNIYFVDGNNKRIRKINISTGIITTIAGNGKYEFSGDGGLATNAGLPQTYKMCFDKNNNFYFAEHAWFSCRIRRIDAVTGIITTVAGNGKYEYSADGGQALNSSLWGPTGLALDDVGNLYVAEYDGCRIRKVDAVTGIISTIAGTGRREFGGDGGPALGGSFYFSQNIALDKNGEIYIADVFNSRIRKFTPNINSLTPLALINISSADTVICSGSLVTFQATVSNAVATVFDWHINGVKFSTTGPTFSTTSLKNGDIVSCTATGKVCNNPMPLKSNDVTIYYRAGSAATVSIAANDSTVCTGSNVTFTAFPKNSGNNPSYQWKINGINAGTNSATFSSSTLIDGDKINCEIIPDVTCGSAIPVTSDTIIMNVAGALSPSITISASATEICPGASITFSAVTQNAGATPVYQWKLNGIAVGNNRSVFIANNLKDKDVVTCELTGTGSCSNTIISSPIVIRVKSLPIISIQPRDTIVSKGTKVQLRTTVSVPVSSFQWTPSAGLTDPNMLSPVTNPINDDSKFEIAVISTEGCTASSKVTISIFKKLYMPTAFTPNGDGLNDAFKIPEGVKISLKEFSIYDSWGNRIFTTSDPRNGWDGILKGVAMPVGVYVYVISGSVDQSSINQKGIVTLIR